MIITKEIKKGIRKNRITYDRNEGNTKKKIISGVKEKEIEKKETL